MPSSRKFWLEILDGNTVNLKITYFNIPELFEDFDLMIEGATRELNVVFQDFQDFHEFLDIHEFRENFVIIGNICKQIKGKC